jgi:AcrR family transcriptional regulator
MAVGYVSTLVARVGRPAAPPPRRKAGRPPVSVSATARARIIVAAREAFARDGYDKTTNKDIAAAAGMTTGAIYHYFASKPALFAAVAAETFTLVRQEFRDAVDAAEPTFVAQVSALWQRATDLHARDRSLAGFAIVSPIEAARHKEIPRLTPRGHMPHQILEEIVVTARARGELADDLDDDTVLRALIAITMGLAHGAAADADPAHHARATAGLSRFLAGTVVHAPTPSRRASRPGGHASASS